MAGVMRGIHICFSFLFLVLVSHCICMAWHRIGGFVGHFGSTGFIGMDLYIWGFSGYRAVGISGGSS